MKRRVRRPEGEEKIDLPRALALAVGMLAQKPLTAKEVAKRLIEKGAPPDVADQTVASLVSSRYIDDLDLAKRLVERRTEEGMGAGRLRQELARRGVDRPLIDKLLTQEIEVDLEALAELLRRRARDADLSDPATKRKLSGVLLRRGHDWETVRKVFAILEQNILD